MTSKVSGRAIFRQTLKIEKNVKTTEINCIGAYLSDYKCFKILNLLLLRPELFFFGENIHFKQLSSKWLHLHEFLSHDGRLTVTKLVSSPLKKLFDTNFEAHSFLTTTTIDDLLTRSHLLKENVFHCQYHAKHYQCDRLFSAIDFFWRSSLATRAKGRGPKVARQRNNNDDAELNNFVKFVSCVVRRSSQICSSAHRFRSRQFDRS